jgi:hypothetical protein
MRTPFLPAQEDVQDNPASFFITQVKIPDFSRREVQETKQGLG